MSVAGVVVGTKKIVLIEGDKNSDGTVTILNDEVFNLEEGDRHIAYSAMHRRIHDRMKHGITSVIVKASSAGKFTGSQDALHAAELRGVFIAAVPDNIHVKQAHVKALSKAGSRKVGEYTKDDDWWDEHFTGAVRKTNREAAYLILNADD